MLMMSAQCCYDLFPIRVRHPAASSFRQHVNCGGGTPVLRAMRGIDAAREQF
jgi:hypothetical protein